MPEQSQVEATEPELGSPSSNGSGELEASTTAYEGEGEAGGIEAQEAATPDLSEDSVGDDLVGEEGSRDAFEEIDFGREFQDYPTLATKHKRRIQERTHLLRFYRPQSLAEHLGGNLNDRIEVKCARRQQR